jgi:hypothetical protein
MDIMPSAAAPLAGVERGGDRATVGQDQRTADRFDDAKSDDLPKVTAQAARRRTDAE